MSEDPDTSQRMLEAMDARPGLTGLISWVERMPSHREALLVCAAEAEIALGDLIHVALHRNTPRAVCERLGLGTSGERPLSAFSARVDMAVALGIVTPAFGEILHGLRRVRNICAHCRWDSFEQEADDALGKVRHAFVTHTPWADLQEVVARHRGTRERLDWNTVVFVSAWLAQYLALNANIRSCDGYCKGRPGYALAPSFLIATPPPSEAPPLAPPPA